MTGDIAKEYKEAKEIYGKNENHDSENGLRGIANFAAVFSFITLIISCCALAVSGVSSNVFALLSAADGISPANVLLYIHLSSLAIAFFGGFVNIMQDRKNEFAINISVMSILSTLVFFVFHTIIVVV